VTSPSGGEHGGGPLAGSFIVHKVGPLPIWAWMGLGLAGALAYSSYKKNKAAQTSSSSSTSGLTPVDASNLTPPFVFVDESTTPVTVNNGPPGAPTPPAQPPSGGSPSPAQPPGTPSGLKLLSIGAGTAALQWDTPTGPGISYQTSWRDNSNATNPWHTVNTTTPRYTWSGLPRKKNVEFTVRAQGPGGVSAYQRAVFGTTT
jgi:hypothetical protein